MAIDYVAKVRNLDWEGLRSLWRAIGVRKTRGWAAGKAFEHLVLRAFELDGAAIRWPYRVRLDEQFVEEIDGAVYADGLSCLIESKDETTRMSTEPVAKLRNQLLRRHAGAIGLVFSRGGFTGPAITLAKYSAPQAILLWEGEEVERLLHREEMRIALTAKYRRYIETGEPHYNTLVGDVP